MKIALYGKAFDRDYDDFMRDVLHLLRVGGVKIIVYRPFWEEIRHCFDASNNYELFDGYKDLVTRADMLFSFGGDGTVLDSVPLIRDSGIPVFGINTGHLGLLSSVSAKETYGALNNILNGNYELEHRSLIQLNDKNNIFKGINYALNELSVFRENNGTLIVIHVFVDDVLLNTYWADGVILATPTGSTAYSMSMGGPIMAPNTNSFLITPAAAHNLSVRPIVIPDNSNVKIKVEGRYNHFVLGLDSRIVLVDKSMEIEVKKTNFCFNMVKMPGKDFFGTIRNKLLWGNDIRN